MCPSKVVCKKQTTQCGDEEFCCKSIFGVVLNFIVCQWESTDLVHKDPGLGPTVILTLCQDLVLCTLFAISTQYHCCKNY